ncbi:hypothetical protein RRF57_009234 [Xylaria bambusicola]|uniref:Uncharacterized protein n=1 Tax=Xylaria bambusicola TaxID=326684 RepID=A0AAN7UJ88_9PEZI
MWPEKRLDGACLLGVRNGVIEGGHEVARCWALREDIWSCVVDKFKVLVSNSVRTSSVGIEGCIC